MALIASVLIITVILALFGLAAHAWGVDSREDSANTPYTYRPYLGSTDPGGSLTSQPTRSGSDQHRTPAPSLSARGAQVTG